VSKKKISVLFLHILYMRVCLYFLFIVKISGLVSRRVAKPPGEMHSSAWSRQVSRRRKTPKYNLRRRLQPMMSTCSSFWFSVAVAQRVGLVLCKAFPHLKKLQAQALLDNTKAGCSLKRQNK